ncbi:MAG: hypothetical protein QXX12_04385 [Nanopusillaceae archaeon]
MISGNIYANRWALKHHKDIVKETVLTTFEEIENVITNKRFGVLRNVSEAYALASKFEDLIYTHPYFRKKHIYILNAIIDRCGEAYYKNNSNLLYISNNVLNDWMNSFNIEPTRLNQYLDPLLVFGILQKSDQPNYVYRITNEFFRLVGPAALALVEPTTLHNFPQMMSIVSGLASIYVVGVGTRHSVSVPTIPSFLHASMVYTLAGLNRDTMEIDNILRIHRVNYVDQYFVIDRGFPVELWRSIRTQAFRFMVRNKIIERGVSDGYELSSVWIRVHEEGVKRYVNRLHLKYRRMI